MSHISETRRFTTSTPLSLSRTGFTVLICFDTLLDLTVSSWRRGRANLLCIVPILAAGLDSHTLPTRSAAKVCPRFDRSQSPDPFSVSAKQLIPMHAAQHRHPRSAFSHTPHRGGNPPACGMKVLVLDRQELKSKSRPRCSQSRAAAPKQRRAPATARKLATRETIASGPNHLFTQI